MPRRDAGVATRTFAGCTCESLTRNAARRTELAADEARGLAMKRMVVWILSRRDGLQQRVVVDVGCLRFCIERLIGPGRGRRRERRGRHRRRARRKRWSGSREWELRQLGGADRRQRSPHRQREDRFRGCVTHADCAPGYFCYLGETTPTTVCGGPAGSCATCQGGTCPAAFECSCLLASLCSSTSPCTDNGKVIVCPQQPQGM